MKTVAIGLLIPFLGTSLGAACVFFMRKALSQTVQNLKSQLLKLLVIFPAASALAAWI